MNYTLNEFTAAMTLVASVPFVVGFVVAYIMERN